MTKLISRIENRESIVGIIGLGYVGLPLLIRFTEEGFKTVGFDIDKNKVESLIKEREEARLSKNFDRADQIRSELSDMGIEIEDTLEGTIWRSK